MSMHEICYTTGLARENGELKQIEHGGVQYYVAELKGDDVVLESRLVPTDTDPGTIRTFLTEWGRQHYSVVEAAKRMIVVQM